MVGSYLHGCHAVICVYDVGDAKSLDLVAEVLVLVRRFFGSGALPYLALVGNKVDGDTRHVSEEQHRDFANQHHTMSYLCSARTGHCVERTFRYIAADLVGIPLEVVQKEWEEGQVGPAGKGVDPDLQVDGPMLDMLTRGGPEAIHGVDTLGPHEDSSAICGCVPRWRCCNGG